MKHLNLNGKSLATSTNKDMINCRKCGRFISHDWSNLSYLCEDCELVAPEFIAAMKLIIRGIEESTLDLTKVEEVDFFGDLQGRRVI